jgi:hypothetical protein
MKRDESKLGAGRLTLMFVSIVFLGYLASDLASRISRMIRVTGTDLIAVQLGGIVSILLALTIVGIMIVRKKNPMMEIGSFVVYALALSLLAFAARLLNS